MGEDLEDTPREMKSVVLSLLAPSLSFIKLLMRRYEYGTLPYLSYIY